MDNERTENNNSYMNYINSKGERDAQLWLYPFFDVSDTDTRTCIKCNKYYNIYKLYGIYDSPEIYGPLCENCTKEVWDGLGGDSSELNFDIDTKQLKQDWLNSLVPESEKNNGWIDVTKKLPEENRYVHIYYRLDKYSGHGIAKFCDGKWTFTDSTSNCMSDLICAWRYLPDAPPKDWGKHV